MALGLDSECILYALCVLLYGFLNVFLLNTIFNCNWMNYNTVFLCTTVYDGLHHVTSTSFYVPSNACLVFSYPRYEGWLLHGWSSAILFCLQLIAERLRLVISPSDLSTLLLYYLKSCPMLFLFFCAISFSSAICVQSKRGFFFISSKLSLVSNDLISFQFTRHPIVVWVYSRFKCIYWTFVRTLHGLTFSS